MERPATRLRTGTRTLLVLACVLAVVIGACSSDAKQAKTPAKQDSTTAPAPPVAPLTGLPDPSGASQTRHALTVKVLNNPEQRPQAGLGAADVVYEEVVEGLITRFAAIYQSNNANPVGPIRSVRYTDPLVVWPIGGGFAYSGGAAGPDAAIKAAPVVTINETKAGSAMFRDRSRRAPFNLFGDTEKLMALGGEPTPPPPLFTYRDAKAKVSGESITSATIGFESGGKPTWTWDASQGVFLRSYGDRPHTDRNTGAQLSAANVVIQFVDYKNGTGNPQAQAEMIGTGTAWILTGGKLIKGTWTRDSNESPTRFLDPAGKVVKLGPGKTWVELPATSYSVDVVTPPPPPSTTTRRP